VHVPADAVIALHLDRRPGPLDARFAYWQTLQMRQPRVAPRIAVAPMIAPSR